MTRKEIINEIKSILKELNYPDAVSYLTQNDRGWLEENIRALEQEPKTGHWKRISMDRYTTHAQYWYECDKCGEHNLGNTGYCPSCGARMIEPQEREG